uniref:Uncharacterized protein n=1 Tax=Arion vulgaris TaxID=1028688 RepID=A0A0B6YIV5_9EUPU
MMNYLCQHLLIYSWRKIGFNVARNNIAAFRTITWILSLSRSHNMDTICLVLQITTKITDHRAYSPAVSQLLSLNNPVRYPLTVDQTEELTMSCHNQGTLSFISQCSNNQSIFL